MYRPPYHGRDPGGLSPRTRELVSRGTLLLIGVVLAYFSLRGVFRLHEIYTTDPQPVFAPRSYGGRSGLNGTLLWPWGIVIGCGLLSLTMILAALLRVGAMQRLFERFGRTPVTGDRDTEQGWAFTHWWPW